jgi:hypothetical protein
MDLIPHSPDWFARLRAINPRQAAMTQQILKLAGRTDVCSICGDEDSAVYRMVAEPGLTLRLCDDCLRLQKEVHGASFDRVL